MHCPLLSLLMGNANGVSRYRYSWCVLAAIVASNATVCCSCICQIKATPAEAHSILATNKYVLSCDNYEDPTSSTFNCEVICSQKCLSDLAAGLLGNSSTNTLPCSHEASRLGSNGNNPQ